MKYFLPLALLFVSTLSFGQKFVRGYTKIIGSNENVANVYIQNVTTGVSTYSAADGLFFIEANEKDKLSFSHTGIQPHVITVTENLFKSYNAVYLVYTNNELEEVTVSSKTQYQKDSALRYQLYRPTLEREKDRSKVYPSASGGVIITNIFSSWMQYVAPKTKRKWKFQKNYAKWEEQKYIETIYTPTLVSSITGLQGDNCAHFMNAYPMPLVFARTGSELEHTAWIKANFADWQKKKRFSK